MEGVVSSWQTAVLSAIVGWVMAASHLDLTRRVRAVVQPWVKRRVVAETPAILALQRYHNKALDALFSVLSTVVSVPFYTGFLPLLFWSGHGKLARQMTILIAFCDYIGNAIKDVISAPRPSCPPVRRMTATKDEQENAMEYGLPSSHALNTVCLAGYLLHYVATKGPQNDGGIILFYGLLTASVLIALIGIGRVYLGMHSFVDVVAGVCFGLIILAFWLTVHESVDAFVTSGQNVSSFWGCLALLLCFAYPTPEFSTPSYEYHTAFNGVAFGIVAGVQQTYSSYHHPDAPHIFSEQLPLLSFFGRVLIGIPSILIVKFCSKALSKWLLPVMCTTLGIPIMSSCYLPVLKSDDSCEDKATGKQAGQVRKAIAFLPQQKGYDIDTGIRFVQYASLAWAVVDLVPTIFSYLNL